MPCSKVVSITLLSLGLPLLSVSISNQACAQTANSRERSHISHFTELYSSYINVTNREEANGLRKIAASDFAIHDAFLRRTIRGEEAFVYATKIYDGTRGSLSHVIRFDLAKVTDQYAVVYAEEIISTLVDVKDSLTPEQGARISNTTSKATATWRWKHTWRMTRQGWKLASLSRDERPKGPDRYTRTVQFGVSERTRDNRASFYNVTVVPKETDFLPVYEQYANAIVIEGGRGIRNLATTGFVTVDPISQECLVGAAAFDEIARWFTGFQNKSIVQGNYQYTVKFSVASMTPDTAQIFTEDILYGVGSTMNLRAVPVGSQPFGSKPYSQWEIVEATFYNKMSSHWKHTWVNVNGVWKLASLEPDTRTDAERETQDIFSYVVKRVTPKK